jgi:phage tail sheath protein FI
VWKAPANADVVGAVGLAHDVSAAEQAALADAGVNPIRRFPGRGILVWGARTLDPQSLDWRYVPVRRFAIFLEASLGKGLAWAVFEPNGEPLWARVRASVEAFLVQLWRVGAFPANKPQEAFFVNCDRTTMTQADLDNGRLVCEVGVAPTRPAEFVIFRIGQWTADRRDPP